MAHGGEEGALGLVGGVSSLAGFLGEAGGAFQLGGALLDALLHILVQQGAVYGGGDLAGNGDHQLGGCFGDWPPAQAIIHGQYPNGLAFGDQRHGQEAGCPKGLQILLNARGGQLADIAHKERLPGAHRVRQGRIPAIQGNLHLVEKLDHLRRSANRPPADHNTLTIAFFDQHDEAPVEVHIGCHHPQTFFKQLIQVERGAQGQADLVQSGQF